nr:hypothetical protein [Candidatus Freyarchaeota archaeon]
MGGYGSDYDYSTTDTVVKRSVKSYNIDQGREYTEVKSILPPPKGKVLVTKAKLPLVVAVDVTGSMREFPKIIFEKLCILYNEVLFFLPEDLKNSFEISFAALGDAYCDQAPLQVTNFATGPELDLNIQSLYPEGGGGGHARETYELVAYYYAMKCELLNAQDQPRPIFIFVGDEGFYSKVSRDHIMNLIGDKPRTDVDSKEVFDVLMKKFSTYILRVKYGGTYEEVIQKQWEETLGKERVFVMEDPRRVVDTIIGIVAAQVDKFDEFKERIEIRQTPNQVEQVYTTLNGFESENQKKYVYQIAALECPKCGAKLKSVPDFGRPVKCEMCAYIIVRI